MFSSGRHGRDGAEMTNDQTPMTNEKTKGNV